MFAALFLAFHDHETAQVFAANAARNPVVVELFTSEGCSSCPPADLLLQKLVQQQPIADAEIIALEEHVDYWNHDGWVDPYSSSEWTERQQAYADVFKDDPYTPEAVVNGRSQFVGNNRGEVEAEIKKAAGNLKTEVRITRCLVGCKRRATLPCVGGKACGQAVRAMWRKSGWR